jgi:hypothetical protein
VVQIKGRQGKRDNKGNSLGVVVYNCNPSTWETKARGSEFQASLRYIARSCL